MAITITGAKYTTTVSAVGTDTVSVAATLSSADFTTQRIVGLWNSAGTTFKGMAWIRRWMSSSQLQLQTAFFDPATGSTVTQDVGDVVLVSKNFSESVTTGLTVSGNTVSITDGTSFTIGTAGSSNSACFYDEAKIISTNTPVFFAGGLTVFGRLDEYATNKVSSPCNWYITASNQVGAIRTSDLAANACIYGGNIDGDRTKTFYIGGNINNLGGGTGGYTLIFNSVQNNFDFASPGAGGSWGVNAARQQLVNCFSQSTATNAILVRWGDGVITGGSYRFPNYTSSTISVFGSDSAGTYNLTTPANQRAIVLDMGNSRALVRANSQVAVTMNFTNLITTDYRSVTGASGSLSANPNGTNRFYYNDSYTNLQTGSTAVILNNSGVVVASEIPTTDTYSPSLLHKTCVGATVTVNAASWTYGFKKYGFLPVGGTITPVSYSLGSGGTTDNVAFGGPVVQIADTSVTLSKADAAALTSISTANDLYDATINWAVSTVTRARYPALTTYPVTVSGDVLDFGAKTLVINNSAANAFAITTGTNTVTVKSTGLVSTAKFTTVNASNITLTTQPTAEGSWADLVASNITLSGKTLYQNLAATTAITGWKTSGLVASGVSINYGTASSWTCAGASNLVSCNLAGTVTLAASTSVDVVLTDCTGSFVPAVSGAGSVRFVLDGTTPRTVLPETLPSSVSVVYKGYLALSNLIAGSSVFVFDASGVQQNYTASTGTSFSFNVTGASSGSWGYKVVKYGQLPVSGVFTPATGGTTSNIVIQQGDELVTDTLEVTQAYTVIDTPQKFYNAFSNYLVSNNINGIARSGAAISVGSYNVVLNPAAASVLSVAGSTITLKSSSFSGTVTTTGSVTFGSGFSPMTTFAPATYNALPDSLLGVTFDTSAGNIVLNYPSGGEKLIDYACRKLGSGTVTVNATSAATVKTSFYQTFTAGTNVTLTNLVGSLTLTGLATDSRVVVRSAGVIVETLLTTGSTATLSNTYGLGTELEYAVFHARKKTVHETATISTLGVNSFAVTQETSDGTPATSLLVKSVGGTVINANGVVSIDAAAKIITFETAVEIRTALAVLAREWVNYASLYATDHPFNLDSLSGIEILDTWTVINPDTSNGEGWFTVAADRSITDVNYNLITLGNTADVRFNFVYWTGNTPSSQPVTVYSGEQNRIFIDVTQLPDRLDIHTQIKRQDLVFIDRTETIKGTDGVWQRFLRNENTNYAQTTDRFVTALLPQDDTKYRALFQSVQTPADKNGVVHTFDRIIEVEVGTQSRAELINQLASVATFNDYFSAKPYTVEENGTVTMTTGTWVRQRDGSALSGNAFAVLNMYSVGNGLYQQPETRLLTISLDSRSTLATQYVVYRTDTNAVLVDASGFEVKGTLTPDVEGGAQNLDVAIWTIQTDQNLPLRVAIIDQGVNYADYDIVLTSGGISQSVVSSAITVIEPNVGQTLNNPTTGILAWNSVITEATFDSTAKDIVIPTQTGAGGSVVKSYNLTYLFFAWRRWVIADVTRLRFGEAVYAEHQLAPPGVTDKSYQFLPGVYFNSAWALNVSSSRAITDIVRLEASTMGRRDTAANSGLIYRSPMANGASTMAEVSIAGAATETIRNAYLQSVENANQIAILKSNLGVVNAGVQKASLALPHTENLTN